MGSRLENDETPFPAPRRAAVAQVLGVPESWFTEPLDALVSRPDQETPGAAPAPHLDAIERKLDHLTDTVDALLRDAHERLFEALRQPAEEKPNGQESAATGS